MSSVALEWREVGTLVERFGPVSLASDKRKIVDYSVQIIALQNGPARQVFVSDISEGYRLIEFWRICDRGDPTGIFAIGRGKLGIFRRCS